MDTKQTSFSWLDRPVSSFLPKITIETLLLAILIILTVFSRFIDLDARVMSHDEVNHVVPSYELYTGQGYAYSPVTHGPLQFHLIALSYFMLGDSDFSARVPAALFSIGTVLVAAFAFRRYLGRVGSLIAGYLYLISPYMLFYGRYTRNEAFSGMWGILLLYGVLRYLDKGEKKTLYFLTTVIALHFCDKATAYIYNAQILIFLAVLLLFNLVKKKWPENGSKNRFALLMGGALILVISGLLFGVWHDSLQTGETYTATMSPQQTLMIVCIALAALMAVGAIIILVRSLGWKAVRAERSFDLAMLVGLLTLPQLGAFPVRFLGINLTDFLNISSMNPTQIWQTAAVVIALVLIAFALGFWWNARQFLGSMALFYAIYIPLYTTFFTNGVGFFAGLLGSLGYWLAQQAVNRGAQPWYYYVLVQVPLYEYLPALGSIAAVVIALRHKLFTQVTDRTPAEQLPEPEEETSGGEDEEAEEKAADSDENSSVEVEEVEKPNRVPVLALLLYWGVTSLVAFSLAGEKMPWLTLHITNAFILAAGWALGYLVETTQWKDLNRRQGFLALLLMPVFFTSLIATFTTALGDNPPFRGSEIVQLQATATFIISAVMFVASGAGIMYLLRDWMPKQLTRVMTLVAFALLAVLTARTAYTAAFINYDNANEYLVYAHAASGPKQVLTQVEEISRRLTKGKDIVVAYDNETLYPYWWYFRDYPNKKYFADSPTRDIQNADIILVGEGNYSKIEAIVKDDYYEFEYMRLWWPNQDYYNLTWERISNALTDPQMRQALFDLWLDRDFTLYGKITTTEGTTNTTTLENWQPSNRMKMYIRKDIAAKIWNYGAAPASATEPAVDPYAAGMINLSAELAVGSAGSGTGQFNMPHGVAVAPDGTIYVADTFNNRIQHFSADGELLQSWGALGDASLGAAAGGTFKEPWGVAVGQDGSVYVSDTWNHRIQKFSADGTFIRMWGTSGTGESPENFYGPRGIVVDGNNHVLVADTGNKRVVVYDTDGNFLGQFGGTGMEIGQFDEPVGLAVDSQNNVYVADTWNQRVQVFAPDATGTVYTPLRSWSIEGWKSQSVDNKPFIAVDNDGNVFITDPEAYRVLEFTGDGSFVRGWESTATGESFLMPSGVAVDKQGRVWVSDPSGNKLFRYVLPSSGTTIQP